MLGRLEDLSVSDIIQIIFLSRRTGVLEISDTHGTSSLLFIQGLIVNASSPGEPDLATQLRSRFPVEGLAALEQGLIPREEFGEIVLDRIRRIVAPLLVSREGSFNFVMTDSVSADEIEYDPIAVFGEPGVPPQRVMTSEEGKLKPLRGLAETMSASKALRRSSQDTGPTGVLPDPIQEASLQAIEARFRIGSLTSTEYEEHAAPKERSVVVVEPDSLVRVAIRRCFAKYGIATLQFNSPADAIEEVQRLVGENRFFVTILESQPPSEKVFGLLQFVKRSNRRLPVLVVHHDLEPAARRRLAEAGADVFARRPAADVVRRPSAAQELDEFCSELCDLSEKAWATWDQMSTALGSEKEAQGQEFYALSEREKTGRGMGLLKQFINELSEPADASRIIQMILGLAREYLDRGVLFAAGPDEFVAVGVIGNSGETDLQLRLSRREPSVLRDVAETRIPHRGQVRRERANEALVRGLGGTTPREATVLPVLDENDVAGILYGDNALTGTPIGNTSGLELFLSQAGSALRSAMAK